MEALSPFSQYHSFAPTIAPSQLEGRNPDKTHCVQTKYYLNLSVSVCHYHLSQTLAPVAHKPCLTQTLLTCLHHEGYHWLPLRKGILRCIKHVPLNGWSSACVYLS